MEMENPFFTNRGWYYPAYGVNPIHESYRSAQPAHRSQPIRESYRSAQPAQGRNSAPKVVQIPVHFVGSKQVDRAVSAVKIQKVFRGFFVRKCLKKVRDVRVQVDEIEEKLWESEVVELVRRDEKERLRINETLMSLLFKLDSISGLDLGVRACRKAVIRKVISLQERIDAIVAANCKNDDELTEIGVTVESETSNSNSENSGDLEDCGKSMEGDDGDADIIDVGVDCEVRMNECNGENRDLVAEGVKDSNNGEVKVQKQGNELDDNKINGDLLERIMEESEKMIQLIVQMNERNEMQTKMLNALTHRVEMLEKAFVCDRLRKKKKRAKASPTCKEN